MPLIPSKAWEALSPRQRVLAALTTFAAALLGLAAVAWLYGSAQIDPEEMRRFAEAQPAVARLLPKGLKTESSCWSGDLIVHASFEGSLVWRIKPRSVATFTLETSRTLSMRRVLKAEFETPEGERIDLRREAEAWFLRGERP